MFDWTEKEENNFYNENIENFARELKTIKNPSYYIKNEREWTSNIYNNWKK